MLLSFALSIYLLLLGLFCVFVLISMWFEILNTDKSVFLGKYSTVIDNIKTNQILYDLFFVSCT